MYVSILVKLYKVYSNFWVITGKNI